MIACILILLAEARRDHSGGGLQGADAAVGGARGADVGGLTPKGQARSADAAGGGARGADVGGVRPKRKARSADEDGDGDDVGFLSDEEETLRASIAGSRAAALNAHVDGVPMKRRRVVRSEPAVAAVAAAAPTMRRPAAAPCVLKRPAARDPAGWPAAPVSTNGQPASATYRGARIRKYDAKFCWRCTLNPGVERREKMFAYSTFGGDGAAFRAALAWVDDSR